MNTITLGVYRRLDNRSEGLDDDSPRALELHNRRKAALHAALDGDPAIRVTNWGNTDDRCPHEFVELLVSSGGALFHYAIVPGAIWLGTKLVDKAVDEALSEFAKAIFAKLQVAQKARQIQDYFMRLPDGTAIQSNPPDQGGTVDIMFKDGTTKSFDYLNEIDKTG